MKIYTKDEFEALSRDDMYKALKELSPNLAKGKSRAQKTELTALYRKALEAQVDAIAAASVEHHAVVPYNGEDMVGDSEGDGVVAQADTVPENTPHVHGPNCGHEHMERVNPEMPENPAAPLYTFKDGSLRSLSAKEQYIFDRMQKAFAKFCNNPADTTAKKSVLADIFSLGVHGVIVDSMFKETIERGRAELREQRRLLRTATVQPSTEKPVEQAAG